MRTKTATILLVFIGSSLLLLLSACESKIAVEVYLRDIYDCIEASSCVFSAYGTFWAELNESDYQKYKDFATEILRKYFASVDNVRYENSGYVANVEITTNPQHIFYFSVQKSGTLFLHFNDAKFDSLNSELHDLSQKESYLSYSLSPSQMSIKITFINDLRKTVTVETTGAMYVDDQECPFPEKFMLRMNQRLSITFSNVLRDYLTKRGSAPVLKVYF